MQFILVLCFQLEGFDRYKYACRDTSPLSNYVMHPFWNKAVLLCPHWVAPNLLTLVGFICCVLHYLLPAIYDYDFTASLINSDHPIPNWVWLLVGVLLFASHTLDGIDGKQARRTGTSSPLGKYSLSKFFWTVIKNWFLLFQGNYLIMAVTLGLLSSSLPHSIVRLVTMPTDLVSLPQRCTSSTSMSS